MKINNILFLYSTQTLSRTKIYTMACRELHNVYGYNVVFTYNGPIIEGIDDIRNEHFETWLRKNTDSINMVSIVDLEKKYRRSNFWQAAVIERNLTDYSFLGGAFAKSDYGLNEIEWYLKALVLFYEYVIAKYEIQAALQIVADNIHQHVIYELSKSVPILPFAIGRGVYWFDDRFYLQTDLNYGSKPLLDKYHQFVSEGDQAANPNLSTVDEHVRTIKETPPSSARPKIIYSKSAGTTIRNALETIKENYKWISLRRPTIADSNQKIQLVSAFLSLIARLYNISWMRRNVTNRSLPSEPYVFFPLHYQPEASILGASPGYRNQLGLARLLSGSLPSGFRLVIKDHPHIGGLRKPAFYKNIVDLKNAVLMDDRMDSRTIINQPNCQLMVTIGGTAGLEGMLFGKPLLIFGRVYYDCMKTLIRPPADLNDMPSFMKQLLIEKSYPSADDIANDAKIWLSAWLSIMKPVGKATSRLQGDRTTAGRDWARVVNDLIKQIEASDPCGESKI